MIKFLDDATARYFAFLDRVTADAEASPAGKILKAAGFAVHNSGGNCMLWMKESPDRRAYLYLSAQFADDASDLGVGLADLARPVWAVGIYDTSDSGIFDENDDALSLADAIQWGDAAFASPDAHLAFTDSGASPDKLDAVARALRDKGLAATYEYPGFLLVQGADDTEYSFGFANTCFGWDIAATGRGNPESGERKDLTKASSVADLIACVEFVTEPNDGGRA